MTTDTTFNPSYRKYLSFSDLRLQETLDKQRDAMPELVRQDILEQVRAEKKRLRSVNAQRRVRDALWKELMRPLKNELRIVTNMQRYISKAYKVPERTAAILAYRAVLEKLVRLLTKYQKQGENTPQRTGKEKNVPNDGAHWVDWIPAHVKQEITDLFDAIPHTFKSKSKTPFERRSIEETNAQKRRRLMRTIEQELSHAYKDLANDPNEYDNVDHHEYIARMELAKKAVIALSDDDYVPATWQGLFKQ